ncbi:hypothetical protein [Deinococcus kurensis]|uniref:hypothetical protein n=1 Tax=Deinococcus kurensis TaxID=2662757 RepID=UPI0012D2CB2F|nr:hypothetical protein [Deinococcus kurensis]
MNELSKYSRNNLVAGAVLHVAASLIEKPIWPEFDLTAGTRMLDFVRGTLISNVEMYYMDLLNVLGEHPCADEIVQLVKQKANELIRQAQAVKALPEVMNVDVLKAAIIKIEGQLRTEGDSFDQKDPAVAECIWDIYSAIRKVRRTRFFSAPSMARALYSRLSELPFGMDVLNRIFNAARSGSVNAMGYTTMTRFIVVPGGVAELNTVINAEGKTSSHQLSVFSVERFKGTVSLYPRGHYFVAGFEGQSFNTHNVMEVAALIA